MRAKKKDEAYRKREDDFRKSVGHRLLLARKALGKKRSDWTERYNIITSRYSQWETGNALPDMLLLTTICDDHGISLDYILRGIVEGEKPRVRVPAGVGRNKHPG